MSIYWFPPIAELPSNPETQIAKIVEEVQEIREACSVYYFRLNIHGRFSKETCYARENYGMELLDAKHAIETALQMEFSEKEVEDLTAKVIEKNEIRGYYKADQC